MIILGAEIEGIQSRKDRTIKITIGTNELTPSQSGDIFSLQGQSVFLAIKKADFQKQDLDFIEKANEDLPKVGKTHSQRLRGVFFLLWQKDQRGFSKFDDYYAFIMEEVISYYKKKIDE